MRCGAWWPLLANLMERTAHAAAELHRPDPRPNDVVGIAGEDPEMQFRVNQPVNTDEGNVNGWEFAWQQFFGDSGFGAAASYTSSNGDVDADPNQDPNENQFALVGLSDSANVTLMYREVRSSRPASPTTGVIPS